MFTGCTDVLAHEILVLITSIVKQQMLRQACMNLQTCQGLHCLHTHSMAVLVDKDLDKNLDTKTRWICQQGHLLEAFMPMLYVK